MEFADSFSSSFSVANTLRLRRQYCVGLSVVADVLKQQIYFVGFLPQKLCSLGTLCACMNARAGKFNVFPLTRRIGKKKLWIGILWSGSFHSTGTFLYSFAQSAMPRTHPVVIR